MADDYKVEATRDAARLALHFLDEITEQIKKSGKASDDLMHDYEYGDSTFDRYRVGGYSLRESVEVLEQLIDYEADDQGLWDGLAPVDAIAVMAAETYGNAVYELWKELIERLNSKVEDNSEELSVGPKDWSPHLNSPLKEFVEKHIRAEI